MKFILFFFNFVANYDRSRWYTRFKTAILLTSVFRVGDVCQRLERIVRIAENNYTITIFSYTDVRKSLVIASGRIRVLIMTHLDFLMSFILW